MDHGGVIRHWRGVCLPVGKEKANLILTATRVERLIEVQEACTRLGRCEVLPYDLSDLTGIDGLTNQAIALFGSIDIVFLNAGISQRARAWIPRTAWTRRSWTSTSSPR